MIRGFDHRILTLHSNCQLYHQKITHFLNSPIHCICTDTSAYIKRYDQPFNLENPVSILQGFIYIRHSS